jgi:hypothetical protein
MRVSAPPLMLGRRFHSPQVVLVVPSVSQFMQGDALGDREEESKNGVKEGEEGQPSKEKGCEELPVELVDRGQVEL